MSPTCPCSSGAEFGECCAPLLDGAAAPTAVALMRSRFTAFTLDRTDYLLASWHPSTRPASLDSDPDTVWRRLQIVDSIDGGPDDATGVVEFRASFLDSGHSGLLHERSRFGRVAGRFVYVDGDILNG